MPVEDVWKKKTPREVGFDGADNGTRTRGLNLGKVALYQLSYVRMFSAVLLPEHEYLLYPHSQNLQVRVSCSCFAVFKGLLSTEKGFELS